MKLRRCFLFTYRFLLHLYPHSFRQRFASEMMQLAAEADAAEWPFIFSDTGLAVVRSWLEPSASMPTAASSHDSYIAVGGGSALTASRLFQGLALALAIILGITYLGSLGYLEAPKCHAAAAENIS
ncbi:MAG TPA: hypothetical protein VGG14_12620 [Candidatus Sulfotelmatobacter sp.]